MTVHMPLSRLPDLIRQYITPRRPDLAASLLEVIGLVNGCNRIDDFHLTKVVEAASDKDESVCAVGVPILAKLAELDQRAMDQVIAMATSKQSHVRHNAVLCLAEKTPDEVARAVIGAALFDRSSRVRRKAADWAGRLELRLSIPFLEKAAQAEKNEETRNLIEIELGLLRDGYFLRPAGPTSTYITINSNHGRVNERVDNDTVRELGIEKLVSRLRS